jgi:sugar phosphate isomerase/epimerase
VGAGTAVFAGREGMKIGLKFYPKTLTKSGLGRLAGHIDFVELLDLDAKPADFRFVKDLGLGLTVHNRYLNHGVNLANKKRLGKNKAALESVIRLANDFSSAFVVVHPGDIENARCTTENSAALIRSFNDRRLIAENMPSRDKYDLLCRTPQEMKAFMRAARCRLCLDISHAAAGARGAGADYLDFIREFTKLKPPYVHFMDSLPDRDRDSHLHLGSGKLALEEILKILPKRAMFCLETPTDVKGRLRDIKFLKENL